MNWNKIIAVLFTLVFATLSVGFLLPAKEDENLVYGALGFFVVSLSLLWLIYALFERKQPAYKTIWFCIAAIGISSLIIPFWLATETFSNKYYEYLEENFINTRVIDVHDEFFFTDRNNPIGIRLRYTVTFPRNGHYFPMPSVHAGKSRAGHFYPVSVRVNPLPKLEGRGISLTGYYKAGVPYEIIADLRPYFLLQDQETGNPCVFFASSDEENLIKSATVSQRLEIDIDGTSFNRYYGNGIHYLEHEYNLKAFYNTIVHENIPRCVGY